MARALPLGRLQGCPTIPRVMIGATVALFLGTATVFGQMKIPDTPAGHILEAWLDAFNSGDRAKIQAYIETFDPKGDVDGLMAFGRQTGGVDLLSIDASEPLSIKFRAKDRATPIVGFGFLRLREGHPPTVGTLILRAIPPGVVFEDIALDAQSRRRVVEGAVSKLEEFYVFPEAAQKMAEVLQAHLNNYGAVTDATNFAALLTEHLQAVSHDKHLQVIYEPFKQPAGQPERSAADQEAQMTKEMQRINCGFEKIEILPGNIGYLKFNGFGPPAVCGPTAIAAMNFLAHADAIIFDLRENGGGHPEMVALISSYLFDQPTHLTDIYTRKEDSTTQYWTLPFVPGARLPDKPAFVLTSKNTFSAAEDFSYNLKCLKRATIIGETTGGGAHPVTGESIDDHFVIIVPHARSINPISKTNWEGTGVEPDVPAKASEALDVAIKLATDRLQKN